MRKIAVFDKMQQGYTYECTMPVGKKFHPNFCPDLSPKEMLALGVFGGRYLRDCREEFPSSWFSGVVFHPERTPGHSVSLNYFRVEASQSLFEWRKRGWINVDHDPRGWFQWYCRYYMGRRLEGEDERQIKRWKAMRRHLAQLSKHCPSKGESCRRKQRQALLHWAYDTRIKG